MIAALASICSSQRAPSRGFMLLALLIALALSGIALMAAVDLWTLQGQREREQQLLYAGHQYRQAIRSYYFAAPTGSPKTLPVSLESLLEDPRYPVPVRHLRRLYPDPISGKAEWGELRLGERLAGVYSLSEAQPIKQAGFPAAYENFAGRSHYQEWVFSFTGASRDGAALPAGAGTKTNEGAFLPKRSIPGGQR